MYPETLLYDIPWSFDDTTFDSLEEFVKAVTEYHASLELGEGWKANEIAIDVAKLTVVTEEVYDKNEEEVDLSFEIKAAESAFTNGELLFKLHNAFAEKIKSGYELADRCFFEGLNRDETNEGQYNCYLGS